LIPGCLAVGMTPVGRACGENIDRLRYKVSENLRLSDCTFAILNHNLLHCLFFGISKSVMSASKEIVLAFDAYGTLLSTESIAKKLAEHFGQEKATGIAAKWRLYQLEYTWQVQTARRATNAITNNPQAAEQHGLVLTSVTSPLLIIMRV
jgi:hypothetical protein